MGLLWHQGANATASPSVATLARELGYSDRAVRIALVELERAGVIEVLRRPAERLPSVYRVCEASIDGRPDVASPATPASQGRPLVKRKWATMTLDAPRDPRLRAVGPDAAWLWVIALCHTNEREMHGYVAFSDLDTLTAGWWSAARAQQLAAKLVKHGLWSEDSEHRCWQFSSFGVEPA